MVGYLYVSKNSYLIAVLPQLMVVIDAREEGEGYCGNTTSNEMGKRRGLLDALDMATSFIRSSCC
jgi:hypothetical protein